MQAPLTSVTHAFLKQLAHGQMCLCMVEQRALAFMSCSWNRISTTSFSRGSNPEWCTPMPLLSSGSIDFTAGISLSTCTIEYAQATDETTAWRLDVSTTLQTSCAQHIQQHLSVPSHLLKHPMHAVLDTLIKRAGVQTALLRSGQTTRSMKRACLCQWGDGIVEDHFHSLLLLRGIKVEDGAILGVCLGHMPGVLLALPTQKSLRFSTLVIHGCCLPASIV